MSYQFVEQLHKKAVPVVHLCRVLGVSRSGYYGARQRAKLAPKVCLVSTQLKAEFAASGNVYGSRRLCAVLRAQGLRIGRHRVRRLMCENRLRALWRRKFVHTTDSGHALPVWDNLLARRFNPSGPNQAWVSDITYIRTRSGWLYCAGLISPDTLIGEIHLDEENDQETKTNLQRGVQAASRADDSPAGLERGRCLPRHETRRDGGATMASPS